MVDWRLIFDVIAAAGVLYAIFGTQQTKRQLTTQQALLTSKDFQEALGGIIQANLIAAFQKYDERVKAISDEVFTARLLALIQQETFVSAKEHRALTDRIDDLSKAINDLRETIREKR